MNFKVTHLLLNMVMKAVVVILSMMLCSLKPWATTSRDWVNWINWVIKRLLETFVRT